MNPFPGNTSRPHVTIACCGLGHVRRGAESWAQDLAELLAGSGHPVLLAGGAPFRSTAPSRVVPTLRREAWAARLFSQRVRYVLEQALFTRGLARLLARQPTAIVHVSDPQVGWWLRERFRAGGPAVLFRDGSGLGPEWLWRFEHVQVLAPHWHKVAVGAGAATDGWHVIPHFVDPARFHPGDRGHARPAGAEGPVFLAVGDFDDESGKRLAEIIGEVAAVAVGPRPRLRIAGNASAAAVARLERLGRSVLPGRLELLPNLSRDEMAGVYRTSDLLVHAALREPFGLALIEAMASALPVIAHEYPVTRWIVGDGGMTADLSRPLRLRDALERAMGRPGWIREAGARALARARGEFGPESALRRYQDAYAAIAARRAAPAVLTGS